MSGSAPTPRTTADLVRGIVDVQEGVDLTPFIMLATSLTTSVCGGSVTTNPTVYTDGFVNSYMELIERWLAAHFYTIFDNQLVAAKAGTAAVTFSTKTSFNLMASMYGQQVMMMDIEGNLAKYNNAILTKKKVKVGLWGPGCRPWYPGQIEFGELWSALTVEQ